MTQEKRSLLQKFAAMWRVEAQPVSEISLQSVLGMRLRHLYGDPATKDTPDAFTSLYSDLISRERPAISTSTILIPEVPTAEGTLIRSSSLIWSTIIDQLAKDWNLAYAIDSRTWEELVAGAFAKDGYEVTLTPCSGDYGRDVIAIRHGVGCIKLIGSVKAYKPGHLVKHDDVRALLGVLSGELDASKGMVTTTSDFAPRIATDPFIKPFLPTRLELMNGHELRAWLLKLTGKPTL
jgi:restriction system protein